MLASLCPVKVIIAARLRLHSARLLGVNSRPHLQPYRAYSEPETPRDDNGVLEEVNNRFGEPDAISYLELTPAFLW